MVRKSKGRQKVEMVKMANDSNLQVTFSKRRSGLFKKASELCTLCGAEIAIIVFSPGRKVFSFGHPCVESVIDRYLTRNPAPLHQNSGTMQLIEAHRNANVRDLNGELTQVTTELEKERKHGDDLNSRVQKAVQAQCWWEAPIDEMGISHCEQLAGSLEDLKKVVTKHVDKMVLQNATMPNNPNPYFAAGSSSSHPTLIPNAAFSGMPVMPPHANPLAPPHAHPLAPPHAWNPGYGRFF